jgi:hypothetical protein
VNEYIGTAFIRLDKAEAFIGVKEFYGACIGHGAIPFPCHPIMDGILT